MALILADRVKETSTTSGSGVFTLAGAASGFQSFAIIGNTNTTFYCIAGQSTGEWEVGIGTYATSGTTLTRTTVLSNSSATQPSALSFAAGTKDVFVTYPSGKSVNLDASGNATALGTPVAFVGTNITGTASGLTAGNVTTNANLTGPITSVGNATSIASQTGTGTKFVVDTSPTLVTPIISSIVNTGTLTLPTATDTLVARATTDTLTNKRITPRVNSTTTTTSPWAWDSNSFDVQEFTALANALTINADAGTPTDGQKTILRFKDNATTRTLTFTGAVSKGFQPIGVTMTVSGSNFTYATTVSKITYFGCVYNSGAARWDIVAIAQQA